MQLSLYLGYKSLLQSPSTLPLLLLVDKARICGAKTVIETMFGSCYPQPLISYLHRATFDIAYLFIGDV